MLKFCVKKLQKPKKFLTFTAELKKYNRLSDSLKQHLINQPKSITFLIMKKFSLPVAGLLCGIAGAQADVVTINCYEVPSYWRFADKKIFDPIDHELIINEDGTYTVKKFLNSELDLTFSVDGTRKVYNGDEEYRKRFPEEVWNSPILDFAPPVYTSSVENSAEAKYEVLIPGTEDPYMYKVMPVDGYVYYSLGQFIPVPKKELSFPVIIYRNHSVAEFKGEDDKGKHYRIWVANRFRIPVGNKVDEYGNENPSYSEKELSGWAIFDMTISSDPVNVSYVDSSDNKLFEDTQSVILHREDRSTSVYNFLNSGVKIGLKTTGDEVAAGKSSVVFTEGFDSAKDPEQYQELEGAVYSLVTAGGQTVTGPVMVRPAGCYAEQIEEYSLNKAHYKAYVDIKVGDVTGYTVFEMNGTPLKKGAVNTLTFYEMKSYDWNKISEYDSHIDIIDDNNFVAYDFLGSGFNVAFQLSEPKEPNSDDSFSAFQELDLAAGFGKWDQVLDDKDNLVESNTHKIVTIPDYPRAVLESRLDDGKGGYMIFSPKIEVYDHAPDLELWGMPDVCHYKDGNGVRKVYAVYFQDENNVNYKVEWEPKADQSGIADIITDSENAPAEWFNLQGIRVSGENLTPGIYVKRQGSKTVKVLVK